MKCVDSGTIQAFIDGELDISMKKDVEKHIKSCGKCSEKYNSLKKSDDFAFGKLTGYRQFYEENYLPGTGNRNITAPCHKEQNMKNNDSEVFIVKKGAKEFMLKYRKIAAAICLVATVTLCATVQPVKAFISDALNIFRVENVKGFKVSLADMEEIRQQLEQKAGEINIDSIGKIKSEGFGARKVSVDEAKAAAGFPVLFPLDAKDGNIEMTATEPGKLSFTMKVNNVNEALKSFGAQKLLPENLDGKTFTADFAYQLNYSYNNGGNFYRVSETKSPELGVPTDVNVDEIYDCLVELPILPDDMRQQLKSIKDWKNTIYLPVVDAEPVEVDINGIKGLMAERKNKGWMLAWYNDGTIYSVDSNAGKDDVLQFARDMR